MDLIGKLRALKGELKKDIEAEIDDSWADIAREMDGEDIDALDVSMTASGRQSLIEHALPLIDEITKALEKSNVSDYEINALMLIALALENPGRRLLGLKLLNLTEIGETGIFSMPPRFRELVEGMDAQPRNIFKSLISIWGQPGGEVLFLRLYHRLPPDDNVEPPSLLTRLIHLAAEGSLTERRAATISKILDVMSDPENLATAEKAVGILEKMEKIQAVRGRPEAKSLAALTQDPDNSNLFYQFYASLPGSENEEVDPLVRRLLKVAVAAPAGVVRNQFISKALEDSKDPERRGAVEKILNLLEDPEEVKYMDAASSKEEYIEGYKVRKRNGGGSGSRTDNGSNGRGVLGRIPLKKPFNYMIPAYASVPQAMQVGSAPWMMAPVVSMPFSSAVFVNL